MFSGTFDDIKHKAPEKKLISYHLLNGTVLRVFEGGAEEYLFSFRGKVIYPGGIAFGAYLAHGTSPAINEYLSPKDYNNWHAMQFAGEREEPGGLGEIADKMADMELAGNSHNADVTDE